MHKSRILVVLASIAVVAVIAGIGLATIRRPTSVDFGAASPRPTPAVAVTVSSTLLFGTPAPVTAPPVTTSAVATGQPTPYGTPPPHATPLPLPSLTGPPLLNLINQETARSMTSEARWLAPAALDVDRTTRIGLAIGSGPVIVSRINRLLPSTSPIIAGPVKVGPTVGVTLRVNPDDATVAPSEKVNASMGSDIQMLWTWLVHPLRPTRALLLTATLELPLNDGYVIENEFSLSLEVRRTLPYTAREILTDWATLSAIGTTAAGAAGWLLRRRRKRAKIAQVAHDEG
jgi:LPXTG-motif cell wall-anchored protein